MFVLQSIHSWCAGIVGTIEVQSIHSAGIVGTIEVQSMHSWSPRGVDQVLAALRQGRQRPHIEEQALVEKADVRDATADKLAVVTPGS